MWLRNRQIGFGFDPFAEWGRWHRELNRQAERTRPNVRMEVRANDHETQVSLDAPGMEPNQFDITVTGQVLSIEGQRNPETTTGEQIVHRRERRTGRFVRSVELPYEVDEQQIAARYEQGVLHVRLPRSEGTKPRKIEVQA